MKIVMDKRLGQAESERQKLVQQLMWTRNPGCHGSEMSVNSNSANPGASSDVTENGQPIDCGIQCLA